MKLHDTVAQFDRDIESTVAGWKEAVFIFGAGKFGKLLRHELSTYPIQVKFIDNDSNRIGSVYENTEVISFREYLDNFSSGKIVIAVSAKNLPEIETQLIENGLMHRVDYYYYNEFRNRVFPIISTYCYNKSYVPLAQISLTERCTLKCKKCAHACYAVDHTAQDMTLDEVYRSADVFFSKVDFIQEFVLIGGEPLLYRELDKAIQYIGSKYRGQMGIFSITTNGTIIPSESVLEMCVKYQVLYRISNYQKTIPRLKEMHDKLIHELSKYSIEYILGAAEHTWTDYGFDYVDRKASPEELMRVFDECQTPCREIRGNKFYFCVMARSVSENLGFPVGEDDYLDMNSLQGENYKADLLKFNLGYSKKGYLDMCNFCHGAERKRYLVPAAEQK